MPYKDPAKQREFQRLRLAAKRAEFFAGKACVKCGATEDLHLHHRDPRQKVTHAFWSWREERRLEEIAKCDVLCGDCHRQHHARLLERHGTRSRYKRGCRCGLCRWAKAQENERYRRRRAAAV